MPEHRIFISDLHYGAFSPAEQKKMISDLSGLAEYCAKQKVRLTILGDLFDYWMEYPGRYPELGSGMLSVLRRYMETAGPILYITGNHDNWTRGYFRELGFDVEPEYRVVHLNGKKVFLHHGDGLADRRLGLQRPLLHRLLRHPLFVKTYQTVLPPRAGIELMRRLSGYSRLRSRLYPERLNRWSRDYLSNNDSDFVISGHDHIPRIETFSSGTYLNCGSFYHHRTMVRYTNEQFELVAWDSESNQPTQYNRVKTT